MPFSALFPAFSYRNFAFSHFRKMNFVETSEQRLPANFHRRIWIISAGFGAILENQVGGATRCHGNPSATNRQHATQTRLNPNQFNLIHLEKKNFVENDTTNNFKWNLSETDVNFAAFRSLKTATLPIHRRYSIEFKYNFVSLAQ